MNSVQLEILKIDKQWYHEVKKNPSIPLFICLGEKHEVDLFDTYFKFQGSEEASTHDIFLVHYQEFQSMETYGSFLAEEWREAYAAWGEQDHAVPVWEEERIPEEKQKSDAYRAVNSLKNLYKIFPELDQKKIFVHLAPLNLRPELAESFGIWIQEWCKLADKNIKLVLTEHHTYRSYKNLPQNRKEFRVEIDLHKLMQNAAEQTNRDKGSTETNFQQQILLASNYLSKGKNKEALTALEKGARIAKQQKLNEAEATARLMMAQVQHVLGNTNEAHVQYKKIIQLAGESFLGIQMNMNYGGFLISISEKSKAVACFEKALEIAEKQNNSFVQIECYRMIGQLKESKLNSESVPYYEKCLEIGRMLPDETLKESSIPYTATLLLKKYGENRQARQLEQEMKTLLGDDWKRLAKTPEIINN